ncbi:lysoplasmalogenase [Alteromonas facilis]|uniref:lysoplasmalogenase n=1 Tax=Alteromonas facilis TaxID=2048004 RepID=UPI0013DCA70C|nr:lysoplasmalogenase [Alteromonas facilis]
MRHWLLGGYIVTALGYLTLLCFWPSAVTVLHKALPVSLLVVAVLLYAPVTFRYPLLLASIASVAGDISLALTFEQAFIVGLGSFLLAHLGYCVAFYRYAKNTKWPFSIWFVLGYMGLFLYVLLPHAGTMTSPVSVYACVIAAMVVTALKTRQPWLMGGALLFMFSDSIIGYNRFVAPIAIADIAIMTTYYAAQWGLIWPFVKPQPANP